MWTSAHRAYWYFSLLMTESNQPILSLQVLNGQRTVNVLLVQYSFRSKIFHKISTSYYKTGLFYFHGFALNMFTLVRVMVFTSNVLIVCSIKGCGWGGEVAVSFSGIRCIILSCKWIHECTYDIIVMLFLTESPNLSITPHKGLNLTRLASCKIIKL